MGEMLCVLRGFSDEDEQGILISAIKCLNDGLTIGREERFTVIHATMSNRGYSEEYGALLSIAVGDGAGNLHNMVLHIADESNAP